MDSDSAVRQQVISMLKGGQAFDSFQDILAEFTHEMQGRVPTGAQHSAWQILEHMRIALEDILAFSTKSDYKEKNWPADYWPHETTGDWDSTSKSYETAMEELITLVRTADLYKPFAWGDGQTLLREALLAADHAAYHLGQLVLLRTLSGPSS